MSGHWEAIIFVIVLVSIPVHALVLAYFLNRRWYRRKKRALLAWLEEKGWIESADRSRRRKKF